MHKITNNLVNYDNDNDIFLKKNTINGENLEREIDQKNNVIHNVIDDVITQLQQVKAALQQATHERFSSRPHDDKI